MGLFTPQLSTKTMLLMCRQMATTSGAGIPILRSLELVSENLKDKNARNILARMHDRIRKGSTLADAARQESRQLHPLFVELLASGEAGGHVEAMLQDLADYFEDRLSMKRLIIGKSTYPALQLCAAWFLGTFALGIVSRLSARGFDIWQYVREYAQFQALALGGFAVFVLAMAAISRWRGLKAPWAWAATFCWPIKNISRRFARARFFRSLSLLIGSGAPLARSIERAAATTLNPYLEEDFRAVAPRVNAGETLVQAFAPCKYMTRELREMVHVGEESGRLEESLRKASDYQMQEAVHAVNVATKVGEVVIILGVAMVIGYVVISFWTGYYGGMLDELGV